LLKGRRYEGPPGSAEYKIVEFDKYAVRIDAKEAALEAPSIQSRSTMELLGDSSAEGRAELIWRAGLPLSALVLCLFAIPLSFVNPRAGRSLNLIVAALIYMVYSNLLSIVQAWVAQQKVPPSVGLWIMHAVILGLALAMFRWRLSVQSPLKLRR